MSNGSGKLLSGQRLVLGQLHTTHDRNGFPEPIHFWSRLKAVRLACIADGAGEACVDGVIKEF